MTQLTRICWPLTRFKDALLTEQARPAKLKIAKAVYTLARKGSLKLVGDWVERTEVLIGKPENDAVKNSGVAPPAGRIFTEKEWTKAPNSIYSVCSLDLRSTFCTEGTVTFSFEKAVLFSG
jgi:hypothetical protein